MSDIYNGVNSMAIDLSGYATKQELQSAISQNGKGVFWAVYSQTSRDDIIAAYIDGKVVFCRENLALNTQNIYVLLRRNADDTFDFLSILDNTQIKVNISTSGTWTKTIVPLGGDSPFVVVQFESVPGVGWQANKTFAELQTEMASGKTPFGLIINVSDNTTNCVLVFRGKVVKNNTEALIFYAAGTTLDSEVYDQLPYSTNRMLGITETNQIVDEINPIVGSLYAPAPIYEPIDDKYISVINNGSYVFVDTVYTDIEVTISEHSSNIAANVCIWLILQGITLTSFKVNYKGVELMPPPDLSTVLNAGPGHYSLDVRGNFYSLKKIMSM